VWEADTTPRRLPDGAVCARPGNDDAAPSSMPALASSCSASRTFRSAVTARPACGGRYTAGIERRRGFPDLERRRRKATPAAPAAGAGDWGRGVEVWNEVGRRRVGDSGK